MIGIGRRAEVDNKDGIINHVPSPIAMKTSYRLSRSLAGADARATAKFKSKLDSNSITENID